MLLRNQGGLLPLDPARLRRIAVLGPNAATARAQGGGSAEVFPVATVSPLAGLRAALPPDVELLHLPGVRTGTRPTPLEAADCRNPAPANRACWCATWTPRTASSTPSTGSAAGCSNPRWAPI